MSLDEQLPPPGQPGGPGQPSYPVAPPQRRTSGLAIAGFILAFLVAPVGFILSLIAIFQTGAAKAKGRGLAIAGVVISVLIMAGVIALIVGLSKSTVADPGCLSGKAAILDNSKTINAKSLQATIDGLNTAAAKAKHADVRDAMKATAADYTQLLQATKTGQLPPGLEAKLNADGAKIDSLCSINTK